MFVHGIPGPGLQDARTSIDANNSRNASNSRSTSNINDASNRKKAANSRGFSKSIYWRHKPLRRIQSISKIVKIPTVHVHG